MTVPETLDRMIIWYQCYCDADAICDDDTMKQVAEMLLEGVKPKTMESILEYINSDEEVQKEYADDVVHFYKQGADVL